MFFVYMFEPTMNIKCRPTCQYIISLGTSTGAWALTCWHFFWQVYLLCQTCTITKPVVGPGLRQHTFLTDCQSHCHFTLSCSERNLSTMSNNICISNLVLQYFVFRKQLIHVIHIEIHFFSSVPYLCKCYIHSDEKLHHIALTKTQKFWSKS